MRRVALACFSLLILLVPMTVRAEKCATWFQCIGDPNKMLLRYPRTSLNWNLDLIATGASVTFTHDDSRYMFEQATLQYRSLDPNVPWDQVDLAHSGNYGQVVHWVPQADIAGNPDNREAWAIADCSLGESSNPKCWIVRNIIRFAVDPSTGTDPECWMNYTYTQSFCDRLACGYPLDFQGVATHEVGHSFGLNHSETSGATMYPTIAMCDTSRRLLKACEQDSVRRRYHDNPASSLRGFSAYRYNGGIRAEWQLEGSEQNTEAYLLGQSSDWTSAVQQIKEIPATRARSYQVDLDGVQDGILTIYERESDGTVLTLGSELIGEPPLLVEPPVFTAGNIDSTCAALTSDKLVVRRVLNEPTQNRIYAPDSLMAPARWWAEYKRNYLNINSIAINIDSLGGQTAIKGSIRQLLPMGGSVLLLGSAWEQYSITGEPMRADSTKYQHGRVRDPYPDEPGRDIIRTYFIVDPAPPDASVSDALPWITTDAWFVDYDDNLRADPGYGIGRLPATNLQEAWLLVFKMASEWTGNPWGSVWRMSYAKDYKWNQGVVAAGLVDSLQDLPWPTYVQQYRIENSPTHSMSGAERDAAFTTVFNSGGLFVDLSGTVSGGYNPVDFGRVNMGYSLKNNLHDNHGNLPVVMGWSCFIGNTAGTRNPLWGPRPCDQLLLLQNAGARAVIASSSGTLQASDQRMSLNWYRLWLDHPDWSLGRLLQETGERTHLEDSRDAPVISGFNLLGDPDMTVPEPRPPVVGVKNDDMTLSFSAWPNPTRSDVGLAWAMPRVGHVQLDVYDVTGRRVERLLDQELQAGVHTYSWRPRTIHAGTYFVGLTIDRQVQVRKVTWLR